MNSADLIAQGDGLFTVSGPLDFTTVGELLIKGAAMFQGIETVMLDLTEVSRANSAGLALLLEWQDQMLQQGSQLQIRHAPPALVDIASISNCTNILEM